MWRRGEVAGDGHRQDHDGGDELPDDPAVEDPLDRWRRVSGDPTLGDRAQDQQTLSLLEQLKF